MKEKNYAIKAQDLIPIVDDALAGIASDMIMVEGKKVGYMCREEPDAEYDSGWRFFSGDEDQEYANIADNFAFYKLNTIVNYDPAIVSYLGSAVGTTWTRSEGTDKFDLVQD